MRFRVCECSVRLRRSTALWGAEERRAAVESDQSRAAREETPLEDTRAGGAESRGEPLLAICTMYLACIESLGEESSAETREGEAARVSVLQ